MRIRSIKPDLWTREAFVACSPAARLLWIALNNDADDNGIFEWRPLQIKMRLLPADSFDLAPLLEELHEADVVMRYVADGGEYGILRWFSGDQSPRKPSFVYPTPQTFTNGYGLSRDYEPEEGAPEKSEYGTETASTTQSSVLDPPLTTTSTVLEVANGELSIDEPDQVLLQPVEVPGEALEVPESPLREGGRDKEEGGRDKDGLISVETQPGISPDLLMEIYNKNAKLSQSESPPGMQLCRSLEGERRPLALRRGKKYKIEDFVLVARYLAAQPWACGCARPREGSEKPFRVDFSWFLMKMPKQLPKARDWDHDDNHQPQNQMNVSPERRRYWRDNPQEAPEGWRP
jgi:hypothetical protein